MPVEVLQRQTTNEQFEKWQVYLRMEPNLFHREDFYMMLLIRTIQTLFSNTDPSFELGKYLLKFEAPKAELQDAPPVNYRRPPRAGEKTEVAEVKTDPKTKLLIPPKPTRDYYAGHIPMDSPGTKSMVLAMLGLDSEGKPLR